MSSWVSLFSGGKDSSWALYQALDRGLDVERLVTVHPGEDSYMYHVPATELAGIAAESIGIELVDVNPDDLGARSATDSSAQGDAEVQHLETALESLEESLSDGLAGVTAGAVESEYQTSRIEGVCDRLGIELYAPLWQESPEALAEAMLAAGFDIQIIQVAARGLDESWLGRTYDEAALSELQSLQERYGVHLLGEGGEFETLVTDGPHMDRPIEIDAERVWEGTRGHLDITDAWLGDR